MKTWTELFTILAAASGERGQVRGGCKTIKRTITKILIPHFQSLPELEEGLYWVRHINIDILCSLLTSDTEDRGFVNKMSLVYYNNTFTWNIRTLNEIYPSDLLMPIYNAISKKNKEVEQQVYGYVNEYENIYQRIHSDLETYSAAINGSRTSVVITKGLAEDIVSRFERLVEITILYDRKIASYYRFIKTQYNKWDSFTR
jgi:hypothetical protein